MMHLCVNKTTIIGSDMARRLFEVNHYLNWFSITVSGTSVRGKQRISTYIILK